jgi:hypothetical protein
MEYLDIRSNDSMVIEGCCDDLDALKCETIRLLESPDFDFHPLLPDEDTPIIDRVSALGEWCHGFLNGFAMAQDVEFALEDRDSRELIENFTRICQLEVSDNPDEGDEKALFELVEYVRMGAIFIYAQAGSLSSGSNNGKGIYH